MLKKLNLLARLQAALQFEDIDLVVVNEANPILRFEAISGRSLFCRDAVVALNSSLSQPVSMKMKWLFGDGLFVFDSGTMQFSR